MRRTTDALYLTARADRCGDLKFQTDNSATGYSSSDRESKNNKSQDFQQVPTIFDVIARIRADLDALQTAAVQNAIPSTFVAMLECVAAGGSWQDALDQRDTIEGGDL